MENLNNNCQYCKISNAIKESEFNIGDHVVSIKADTHYLNLLEKGLKRLEYKYRYYDGETLQFVLVEPFETSIECEDCKLGVDILKSIITRAKHEENE